MTELLFPGGAVRIDENQVWRELSAWLSSTNGYGSVTFWQNGDGGKFHALLVTEAGGAEYRGSSRLGVPDAVAQALQVAASAKLAQEGAA